MAIECDEKRFEKDIHSYMLKYGGYTKGDMGTYDKEKAIDMDKLISFIKNTQPKAWSRFEKQCNFDAQKKFYKVLNDEIEEHGLIHVLRHGFKYRGIKFLIAYFKPESTLRNELWELYNNNILTSTRQFYYSSENTNSIDMVLSLNGIPIISLELKDQLKGQCVENAKTQYMYYRNPKELCFQFNKRMLVHFAVDLYDVYMTTKLDGKNTFFLPFNKGSNGAGNDGGAGNPPNENGYVTSYLWEEVLTKDSLLEILQKYIHLQVDEEKEKKNGKRIKKVKKKIIFPRYHQLDVVSKLVKDVRDNGSGRNYLIQHSAGSGKSNSIAWTSYRLANLHDEDNNPIFSSVIVVTDRRVLDGQLQKTISGFDHTPGLVETIGEYKNSKDLRDAINDGKKIIITTLQKFPVIYQEVDSTTGKRFAIIVDEAHTSQTGNSALKLKAALADTEEALQEYAEIEGKAEEEILDGEDLLVNELLIQGRHKNLSFFAFTATPKEKTLEMFGVEGDDGKFRPFHVYSMRQAIEEGFILDVLKNYMTYKTCYRIAKNTPDNPALPVSKATKTVRRFESLHPHNLQQKTAIIIEQFREITKNKIGGKAKAMVVTASRLHAVRYYHEFKRYIERKGYDDVDILVAFSGVVTDGVNKYTESKLNIDKNGNSISDKQLPEEFKHDFNMLVVAEKYQTGFDEPLLHTMFIDKKLSGIKAVQTLSRLNRTYPGKNDTFILDFVNTTEEIQKSFEPYFKETILDEEVNVNLIYKAKIMLREFKLYNDEDVEKFIKINFKKGKQTNTDLGRMTSLLKPIVNRYKELDDDERFKFKRTINNFNKWYSYIIQITRMFDKELHKEYSFTSYLSKLLPTNGGEDINLEGKLKLEFYKLEQTFKGDITLNPKQEPVILNNVKSIDSDVKKEEDELLEKILKRINDKFDGMFNEGDRVIVESLYNKCVRDNRKLKKQAENNDSEMFENNIFPKEFEKIAQECYMEQMKAFSKLFENKKFYNSIMESLAKEAYKDLRSKK